ncbi:glycerophosphodiester phosphodiesterase [Cecembia calidifontis]|uniref:Glycerophosphoryl diester phosphodiesterase n=1 Tax=Cecembia calidifontis TaxID=1187080 RepID=A0A4Q7PE95_9BACT|nr:glycerophosphodiester phosphodiesterase [Cecembia calidifontis]RZS98437.1 glycerophosphoryl diester phosphodiesterase [Cecembia calidifontis]
MKRIIQIVFFTLLNMNLQAQFSYDLQGHRGSRGIMPENTIPAMIKALDLGATTLELDLAITKDGEVIVSHEPWMNPVICLDPEGNELQNNDRNHNIFQMNYAEVLKYDCGTKFHAGFPQQVKFYVTKPRLEDLIDVAEKYVSDFNLPLPNYNVEIKSLPEGDGIYHPNPAAFSEKVVSLLLKKLPVERFNIQSFDFRVLQYIHKTYPEITLAMLVDNAGKWEEQLKELGFRPDIYSPYFSALTKDAVAEIHGKGMKVIPWTVNKTEQMNELLDMGVDGIITDYPNLAPRR